MLAYLTPQKLANFRISLLAFVVAIGMLLLVPFAGCKAKMITVVQTETKTVTTTVAGTTVKVPTQPKLNTTILSLVIVAPAEYASASVAVYISQNQTIHLNWTVVGGPIRMGFSSPNGKVGSVGKNGVSTSNATVLDFIGEVRFSPNDAANKALDWGGSGYYYFIPNIVKGDLATKVTISYWVEG
jgi:hypothetical protein